MLRIFAVALLTLPLMSCITILNEVINEKRRIIVVAQAEKQSALLVAQAEKRDSLRGEREKVACSTRAHTLLLELEANAAKLAATIDSVIPRTTTGDTVEMRVNVLYSGIVIAQNLSRVGLSAEEKQTRSTSIVFRQRLSTGEGCSKGYSFFVEIARNDSTPSVSIHPASQTSVGSRSKGSIMQVVMSQLATIRYAYNKRLRERPDLEGKVTVHFVIDEHGGVIYCSLVESTAADSLLEIAVVERIKTWQFGPNYKPGDVTDVVYPFVFTR